MGAVVLCYFRFRASNFEAGFFFWGGGGGLDVDFGLCASALSGSISLHGRNVTG